MRYGRRAGLVLWWIASGALAAEPLTPETAIDRRQISDLQVSPDGQRVAFVVVEPPNGQEQNADLWVLDFPSRAVWQLTSSPARDQHPRFSPDGTSIAFVSERTEKPQIHVISLRGGEARALTSSETGASSPEWSSDGKRIAYLASIPDSPEEKKKKEEDKDDARVVDRDDRPPQLWLVDVASGKSERITSGSWRISDVAWSSRDELFLAATDDPQPELHTTRLYRLSVQGGEPREVLRPSGPFGNLKVSPDGTMLAFVGSRSDGPQAHDLFVLPLAALTGSSPPTPRNLTATSIDRPIDEFQWQRDGSLAVEVEDGFSGRFFTVALDGSASPGTGISATHPLGSFVVTKAGTVFVGESPTVLPELWLSPAPGQAEKLSSFNEGFGAIDLVAPESVFYSSFDGTRIEAQLLRPPGGEPAPAVVLVHGGPTGRWSARFHDWGQLLVANGIAVLYPNIRGSTGYGMDFLVANRRDWGGADFQDVLAGARYLMENGIADGDRLGIGGWSYGGYMAAWAVTQTDRFRAAVTGAPMTNLVSEYGTEMSEINAYDTWFLGSPYENLELFSDRSPITHVRKAKTPTLILCGENDVTDPVGQCTELYRGLKRTGTETELVLYPREGHGFREESHREDVLRRVAEWFDRHLAPERPPASAR